MKECKSKKSIRIEPQGKDNGKWKVYYCISMILNLWKWTSESEQNEESEKFGRNNHKECVKCKTWRLGIPQSQEIKCTINTDKHCIAKVAFNFHERKIKAK